MGIMDLILSFSFPSPILAPLLFWASIILSASSERMGMKVKASEIMVAISWTGKPMTERNDSDFSKASLISRGLVVRVSTLEDRIIAIMR